MATHDLKVWPEFFAALLDGTKTFEVRRDDRGFVVGDHLRLFEWMPEERIAKPMQGRYTGRVVERTVSYILAGNENGSFGIHHGFCVLGLLPYVASDGD